MQNTATSFVVVLRTANIGHGSRNWPSVSSTAIAQRVDSQKLIHVQLASVDKDCEQSILIVLNVYCNLLLKVSCPWLSWRIQVQGKVCRFLFEGTPRGVHHGLQGSWRLPLLLLWKGRWFLCPLRNLFWENRLWSLCKWGRSLLKRIPWRSLKKSWCK